MKKVVPRVLQFHLRLVKHASDLSKSTKVSCLGWYVTQSQRWNFCQNCCSSIWSHPLCQVFKGMWKNAKEKHDPFVNTGKTMQKEPVGAIYKSKKGRKLWGFTSGILSVFLPTRPSSGNGGTYTKGIRSNGWRSSMISSSKLMKWTAREDWDLQGQTVTSRQDMLWQRTS